MPNFREIGSLAEDKAAAYLLEKGLSIIKRRFKSPYGEIDLIAMEGEVLVMVEVKYRSKNYYLPEETVNKQKTSCVYLAAEDYLYKNNLKDQMLRFDIIVIDYNGLRHFENAF